MLYCEKCHRLTESEACPSCGRARSLRPPQADDPVLLCTVRYDSLVRLFVGPATILVVVVVVHV